MKHPEAIDAASAHDHEHAQHRSVSPHHATPEPKVAGSCCTGSRMEGGQPVDPVCGMRVAEGSPHVAMHNGGRYVFCSSGCRNKFVADPDRYLSKARDLAAAVPAEETPAGTIYTCPMHPEIRQDHPGNCPKCGMALEPLIPELGADEDNPELKDFQRRFWWTLPLTIAVATLANDWLNRWQQQHLFGHGQLLLGTASDASPWPSNTSRVSHTTDVGSTHAHDHDSLERHHHAVGDGSVAALDAVAELADAADSSTAGASMLLPVAATPNDGLVLPAIADRRGPWPVDHSAAFVSRDVAPPLRPPSR